MNVALLRYGGLFLAGFLAAFYLQGLRWDNDVAHQERAAAETLATNVSVVAAQAQQSRLETEKIRASFLEYKAGATNEIDKLESRIASGPERLYIKAKCPAVPAAGTDAGRAGAGAAELDANSTRSYFALERGLAEQYALLQLCRGELKKRSAP